MDLSSLLREQLPGLAQTLVGDVSVVDLVLEERPKGSPSRLTRFAPALVLRVASRQNEKPPPILGSLRDDFVGQLPEIVV
jgi:hypothetical protein